MGFSAVSSFFATMVVVDNQTKPGLYVYAKATQVSRTLKGIIGGAYKDTYLQGYVISSEMRPGNKKRTCYIRAQYTVSAHSWIVDIAKSQIKAHPPKKIKVFEASIQKQQQERNKSAQQHQDDDRTKATASACVLLQNATIATTPSVTTVSAVSIPDSSFATPHPPVAAVELLKPVADSAAATIEQNLERLYQANEERERL